MKLPSHQKKKSPSEQGNLQGNNALKKKTRYSALPRRLRVTSEHLAILPFSRQNLPLVCMQWPSRSSRGRSLIRPSKHRSVFVSPRGSLWASLALAKQSWFVNLCHSNDALPASLRTTHHCFNCPSWPTRRDSFGAGSGLMIPRCSGVWSCGEQAVWSRYGGRSAIYTRADRHGFLGFSTREIDGTRGRVTTTITLAMHVTTTVISLCSLLTNMN